MQSCDSHMYAVVTISHDVIFSKTYIPVVHAYYYLTNHSDKIWETVVACLCVYCDANGLTHVYLQVGCLIDICRAHSCWPKPIQIDWIKGWIRGVAWSSTAGTVAMVWSPNSHYLLKDTIMILSKRMLLIFWCRGSGKYSFLHQLKHIHQLHWPFLSIFLVHQPVCTAVSCI